MSERTATNASRRRGADLSTTLGLTAVIFFFMASGFVSYWNTRTLSENSELVMLTHDTITGLGDLPSLLKDAETGQRGFIMTGKETYLEPYNRARARVDEQLTRIQQLIADNPSQTARLDAAKSHLKAKFDELAETIQLRRSRGFNAALAVVETDRGKAEMDAFREIIVTMQQAERDVRAKRMEEMNSAYRIAIVSGILAALLGVVLSIIVSYLIRRAANMRKRQEWLQSGEVGLGTAMFGEQRVDQLGENILTFLAGYLDGHAGAFYVKDGKTYRRVATFGVPNQSDTPESFGEGDGLLWQVAQTSKPMFIHDVPDGYLTIGSALGKGKPRHLIIAPTQADDMTNAVLELGLLHPIDGIAHELLERVAETMGIAVRSANYREHLQNLLEETQRQAEELQAQSEELRVANEEMEEQSRALKESQSRLEQQQAELEQTNSQLEEQTQLLEVQRDDLARSKNAVQIKAQELEQASQYKSDFLANMSHELRTPLNSSLILAKLLADNPEGNLSSEQVRYAQTIQSSGNDLLSLINDILDLSKIEAGHMEIRAEPVLITQLVKDIARIFDPVAQQKKLEFKTEIAADCPKSIETDRQRLEQVLKNLLSNACKFTEKGKVSLTIRRKPDGQIAFAVTDTGIGISPEQQQAIFEAFRQADGTISRKYGGTGLGLSISRELARLLGGIIEVESEPGKGSTFTITIPESYYPDQVQPRSTPIPTAEPAWAATPAPTNAPYVRRHAIEDDRETLQMGKRVILVVEDDESFARILYDLAHEQDFQCLIAGSAEEAITIARQYVPHAMLLDVGLPDHSGLSVLDRIKRDPRTRHIPVHVLSANDYTQTALSLGAVGYMLKPVKREELVETFVKLEERLDQHMRRVLIVEDDAVQRESVRKLLSSHEVETVGAGTAAECLTLLKDSTFDCMVLDLSLPDASGYSLLETLSTEDAYSFPPVIVYTGRDLSGDEEQRLRRYSKSIIIKGAKSPERLLDEVTLFLHQVVSDLPAEQQRMLEQARNRDSLLEGRRILAVEDDIRNVYALTSIFEPRGAIVQIARNGREALELLETNMADPDTAIDLVLMDVMMPEMDGLTATREIRKRKEWKKLPVIMLTAKAMKDDQERCLEAGANDYMAKPLDVEKLLSLVRVWMPR